MNQADLTSVANAIREKGETTEQLVFPSDFVTAIQAIKGGGDLNFEVVGGTTQPTNPMENTIWVNTEQEIAGWCFSATEPTNPENGMVWFKTNTIASTQFNATKENALYVYPYASVQYVSGTWETKHAKIYQSGLWNDITSFLYKDGDEYSDITGGWVVSNHANGISSKQSDHLYLATGLTSHSRETAISTYNKINFDRRFKLLKAEVDIEVCNGRVCIGASTTKTYDNNVNNYVSYASISEIGKHILSVDISEIKGDYYVKLFSDISQSKVSKVWWE